MHEQQTRALPFRRALELATKLPRLIQGAYPEK